MRKPMLIALAALVAFGLSLGTLTAADKPIPKGDQTAIMKPVFKSSTLVGMKVKNSLGETVGTINELVIDTQQGNIRYAALSVGGFLGIGDKLFAVPWESLTLKNEANDPKDHYFFLNADKERMKNAPGFAKDNWPDFGNPRFGEEIDKYYGVQRVARPVDTTPPKR